MNRHEFSEWLQATIAEHDGPETVELCESAAVAVREARCTAQSLGYVDLVSSCATDALRLSKARDILSRALAVIDPPSVTILTVKQAAERLGVKPSTIYAMVDKGRLRCQRIGRAIRISPRDLDSLSDTPQRYKHLRL